MELKEGDVVRSDFDGNDYKIIRIENGRGYLDKTQ